MHLSFALFEYFPYGGLQRDCLGIAQCCARRGHRVDCYTRQWHGERPEAISVIELGPCKGSNRSRDRAFADRLQRALAQNPSDALVGFNRMPGLSVYFAADPCYRAKVRRLKKPFWYRWTPRYHHFCQAEAAVFSQNAATKVLLLTDHEIPLYQHYYGTQKNRLHLLPPAVSRREYSINNHRSCRSRIRQVFGWEASEQLLLFVGSGFHIKGLDRAIRALASLDEETRTHTRLLVLGQGAPAPFQRLAARLGLQERVHFLGGCDVVYDFMLASDLLIHPARSETAGIVLLEALTAGLPVLTTAACGYAHHIGKAEAGMVVPEPFHSTVFNLHLATLLATLRTEPWQQRALDYAGHTDLYSGHEQAVQHIERFLGK